MNLSAAFFPAVTTRLPPEVTMPVADVPEAAILEVTVLDAVVTFVPTVSVRFEVTIPGLISVLAVPYSAEWFLRFP